MPRLNVWIDPTTGDLIDAEYQREILDLRRRSEVINRKVDHHIDEVMAKMARRCCSLDEIKQFVIKHWAAFYEKASGGNKRASRATQTHVPKIHMFELVNTRFGDLPNTKVCPKNGVTNWGGYDAEQPTSYLGYEGILYLQLLDCDTSVFDIKTMFEDTAVKILHNGRKYNIFEAHFMLFLDDWPMMSEQAAIDRLAGGNDLIDRFYGKMK